MADVPSNIQTGYHTCSNSLPSRSHPLTLELDEHLSKLASFESASTSSISHKQNGFQDLYDCVGIPMSQQAFAQEQHKEWIDELLDGSLRLLDLCNIAKDAVLQTKESTNKLQSVLRRRKSAEVELVSEVRNYLTSRKVVKKTIHKALGNLEGLQIEHICSPLEYLKTKAIISMLREVEAVTSFLFKNLLSLISGLKPGSWSLVSKQLHYKRIAPKEAGRDMNEFGKVDTALKSLVVRRQANFRT